MRGPRTHRRLVPSEQSLQPGGQPARRELQPLRQPLALSPQVVDREPLGAVLPEVNRLTHHHRVGAYPSRKRRLDCGRACVVVADSPGRKRVRVHLLGEAVFQEQAIDQAQHAEDDMVSSAGPQLDSDTTTAAV